MQYVSTRGAAPKLGFEEAMLAGEIVCSHSPSIRPKIVFAAALESICAQTVRQRLWNRFAGRSRGCGGKRRSSSPSRFSRCDSSAGRRCLPS